MDEQLQAELIEFHNLESWQGINTLEEKLFIWQYFLGDDEFPGWNADHIDNHREMGSLRSSNSIWFPVEDDSETLLNIIIHERSSRSEAHTFLMEQLSHFHGPRPIKLDKTSTGDVAFGYPDNYLILYARANLTILLRNADRQLISVSEIARQFDQNLIRHPEIQENRVIPTIQDFSTPSASVQVGQLAPLEISATDPLERAIWYKFYTQSGEVHIEDGQLVYQPETVGRHIITAYAINANRGADRKALEIVVT